MTELSKNVADMSYQDWLNLARAKGGTVQGRTFTTKECFEKCLAIDREQALPWIALALEHGGGCVQGTSYTVKDCCEQVIRYAPMERAACLAWVDLGWRFKQVCVQGRNYTERECFEKALEIDPESKSAWDRAPRTGVTVRGRFYTREECLEKALSLKPDSWLAWSSFADTGGGHYQGRFYTKGQCYEEELRCNKEVGDAWYNLGTETFGGTVCGTYYTEAQCYEQCLLLQDDYDAWRNLGVIGGGHVDNVYYNTKACYENAIRLKPDEAIIWSNLAAVGGGTVGGRFCSKETCLNTALAMNPRHAEIWLTCGFGGGASLQGQDYTRKECFEQALAINPGCVQSWLQLGIDGGAFLEGVSYSRQDCIEQALKIDPNNLFALYVLSVVGGGSVNGEYVTKEECTKKAFAHVAGSWAKPETSQSAVATIEGSRLDWKIGSLETCRLTLSGPNSIRIASGDKAGSIGQCSQWQGSSLCTEITWNDGEIWVRKVDMLQLQQQDCYCYSSGKPRSGARDPAPEIQYALLEDLEDIGCYGDDDDPGYLISKLQVWRGEDTGLTLKQATRFDDVVVAKITRGSVQNAISKVTEPRNILQKGCIITRIDDDVIDSLDTAQSLLDKIWYSNYPGEMSTIYFKQADGPVDDSDDEKTCQKTTQKDLATPLAKASILVGMNAIPTAKAQREAEEEAAASKAHMDYVESEMARVKAYREAYRPVYVEDPEDHDVADRGSCRCFCQ